LVFSVFNPDAIKDLKLYKGGIPANFGGRVSSVLDIYQKGTKRIPHEWRDRVNFQQTITGRSTSKDKGSFLMGAQLLCSFILKLSEEQKNNLSIFMI
jgi:hypothetical protein